jgi:hypothetical protein
MRRLPGHVITNALRGRLAQRHLPLLHLHAPHDLWKKPSMVFFHLVNRQKRRGLRATGRRGLLRQPLSIVCEGLSTLSHSEI